LNLIAATAVAESLSRLDLEARTRWPNDVVVATRKIAGVLAETGFDASRTVILGLGVNTNVQLNLLPESFRTRATSVQTLLKRGISNDRLMRSICRTIERDYHRLQHGAVEDLLQEWRGLSTTLGRRVEVVGANEVVRGFARDIRQDGALLVETEVGEVVTVLAGECRMVT
jgi:BirA family biotin operon repressor/biotin-[acetyl-CoA-carboxylase] ligase